MKTFIVAFLVFSFGCAHSVSPTPSDDPPATEAGPEAAMVDAREGGCAPAVPDAGDAGPLVDARLDLDTGSDATPFVDASDGSAAPVPDAGPPVVTPPPVVHAGGDATPEAGPAVNPACTYFASIDYCVTPGGYACSGAGSIEPYAGCWILYLPQVQLPAGKDTWWCCP